MNSDHLKQTGLKELSFAVIVIASIVTILFVAPWIIISFFEARAFERVTGKHISTLDAMFLDLRIVDENKKGTP